MSELRKVTMEVVKISLSDDDGNLVWISLESITDLDMGIYTFAVTDAEAQMWPIKAQVELTLTEPPLVFEGLTFTCPPTPEDLA